MCVVKERNTQIHTKKTFHTGWRFTGDYKRTEMCLLLRRKIETQPEKTDRRNKYKKIEATSQIDGFLLLAVNFVLLLSDVWRVCVFMYTHDLHPEP